MRRIWAEGGVAFLEDLVRSKAVKELTRLNPALA